MPPQLRHDRARATFDIPSACSRFKQYEAGQNIILQTAKINADNLMTANNARLDSAKVGAQVFAQLTSSAYGMMNASASVSGSGSSTYANSVSYSNDHDHDHDGCTENIGVSIESAESELIEGEAMKKFNDPLSDYVMPVLTDIVKSRAFKWYGLLWVVVLVAAGAKLLGVI